MATLSNRSAMLRRLGINDPRGPQGNMSAGNNVYNGGLPNAQSGGGPQYGRPPGPSMAPVGEVPGGTSPTMTGMVGSLPPNSGSQNPMMNQAIMRLLLSRLGQTSGM